MSGTSLITMREGLAGRHRTLLRMACLLTLSLAFLWAHSGGGMNHMEMSGDAGASAHATAVCVAVLEVGGLVGLLGAMALVARGQLRARFHRASRTAIGRPRANSLRIIPRARAGPAQLQVFRR